jgi:hypothetical protein
MSRAISAAFIGLFLVMGLANAYADIDPGSIVGMWFFDEGTGDIAKDSSGHDYNGTLNGPTWTDGKFGKALEYDATDDYVEIPHHDELSLQTYTIATWTKLKPRPGEWQAIVHKQGAGGNSERNYVLNINNDLESVAHEHASGGANQRLDGVTVVTDDEWHHLAITYDGSSSRVYVDGALDAEAALPPPDTNSAPVRFGRAGGSGGARANGIIDEIIILNVAYSEAEITELMAGLARLVPVETSGKLPVLWGQIKLFY